MCMCALFRKVFAHLMMFLSVFVTLLLLLWKEVNDMAMVYATLIIKGRRTFDSVPEPLKEQVRRILYDCECEFLIEEGEGHE